MSSSSIAWTSRPRIDAAARPGGRLGVMFVAILFGWLLGHVARWFADGLVVNAQLYFHAFRLSFVHSPWVFAPMRFLSGAVLQYSALASWSFVCGYWCDRAGRRESVAILLAVALCGTLATTTSVRGAQPQFFDSLITTTVYLAIVKMLFVVLPIWLAVRSVPSRSRSVPAIWMVAAIGIALAWWHAADLGHALTFGCAFDVGSTHTPCVPSPIPSGAIAAVGVSALSGLMAWDAASCRSASR